ncbi:MAG: hypothetical protein Q4G58_13370 [bacterium]|nr:hypothetical protein [bacterium]
MLYTARPLERVYHDMNEPEEEKEVELKEITTENGIIYAENVDGDYYIRSFSSSCMSDYLDERYQLGSIYHMD